MRPQVVITGLGPVSAIGVGVDAFWDALDAGTTALGPIESFDASGFRATLAAEVRGLQIRDWVPKSYRKATKVMARDTELAVIAARLAALDAGLATRASEDDEPGFAIDHARTGCQIGAGLIAAETEELARAVVSAKDPQGRFSLTRWGTIGEGQSGMNNLPPLWLLKYLPNMLACHVTIIHGLEGPSNTIMGAEASAILSIGEGARVIERDSADICFTGGAESRINPLGLIRWDYAGRLAHTDKHTDPSSVCRPFHPESLGGIMGEAGGMIVIENRRHAIDRKARAYATIEGFGAAQSPTTLPGAVIDHPAPDSADQGLIGAIESALLDADITPDDIDLILPLGLGVPALDAMELGALRAVFADRLGTIPLLTLAQRTGNTMAAHAGLMTAAGAMCLYKQRLPAWALRLAPGATSPARMAESQPQALQRVLVCTASLGGQTGALVLGRIEPG